MLVPISWLKDFVDIKLHLKELMWKMTEIGLTCESYKEVNGETVLDVEITANRPDWMSIIGIAREIAALQKSKFKEPEIPNFSKPRKTLPIKLNCDYKLFERWSAIIVAGIKIKPSSNLIQKRLRLVGLRPINNVVDITNYVMFERGIPLHAFDYDEIKGAIMSVGTSKGGEEFTSVDELTYKLPSAAIIIKDSQRIIDLAGIKGGLNSGIKSTTKNVLLHITIDNPVLIRRASQALSLRSEASAIYERGPDKGGTSESLRRAASLILRESGGRLASELIDLKEKEFKPWKLSLNLTKLEKVLGIKIPEGEVVQILTRLNLNPKKSKRDITCTIPTYRADLKLEEDLIEEVARIYSYNKFPKTLPTGTVSSKRVPYYFDDRLHLLLKNLLVACGYNETMTFSLVSENLIKTCNLNSLTHIKIANPVSSEYEYLRTTLVPNLLSGVKLNSSENKVQLFEVDKVYLGKPGKTLEPYKVAAISKGLTFREFKGTVDVLFERLHLTNILIETTPEPNGLWHPVKSAIVSLGKDKLGSFGEIHPKVLGNLSLHEKIFALEFDIAFLQKHARELAYTLIPQYPPQVEDVTLTFPEKTKVGEVVNEMKNTDRLISSVELRDIYKGSYTFRIWYLHPTKTLTDKEVENVREKLYLKIKEKFGAIPKD